MANIIYTKPRALELREQIRQQIATSNARPSLAVILVGTDSASALYVQKKVAACKEVGIISQVFALDASSSERDLLNLLISLNTDTNVHGILVQLPLPPQINTQTIIQAIAPEKDVDGFHPYNLGQLLLGQASLRPCTPRAVMDILQNILKVDLSGKQVTVVGASNIVGKPLAIELLNAKCTTTICHSQTNNLPFHLKNADIVVSATGVKGLITGTDIKEGAIVIDVGINRDADNKLVGDVDFKTVSIKASAITPVPGGVGPMTVTMLLQNTMVAYNNVLDK